MTETSRLVARLFWTSVIGGCLAFWFGPPAAAATGLALAALLAHRLDRPRRIRRLIRRVTRRHARTLALRRRQECFVDAYGNLIQDGWERERAYFAERSVVPLLETHGQAEIDDALWEDILGIIEAVAAGVDLPDESEAPEDGIAYERYCAAQLREAGWQARATRASGDQGADIVAEQAGVRLVVQCKRYAKPVGNGAVQEIAAAMPYWSGDMAAVVSNAGFTPAARKLAAAAGVLLLHHDDLAALRPVRRVEARRTGRGAKGSTLVER
ncbi:restriction endonuclease [Methylobacterium sp.]|jgi:restriction system protein|uniref:restriction endonuclease n=1 Tax=Methylobacterium sp. TaxID=409 RepID=UPI0025EC5601|nr:restriction endonuclease [Methylobacterium sp.]MBY0258650.1 restriction endonuclease [Methylobacterium sp.]